MDPLNQKQMNYQLRKAMISIFSRYLLYDGQLEQYVTREADALTARFDHFVEHDLLKRAGKHEADASGIDPNGAK